MVAQTTTGAPTARGPHSPWLVTAIVALATFMEVLDITIAAVALPAMAGNLGVSVEESTWVLTSYLVANAIMLPMSGWLATMIGRKKFYMICIGAFTISSLLCGLSPNLEMLIVFRVLQGLSGAGMVPISQAIMADTFPPEKRGMAFALFALVIVLGPAIGPALGGWLTDHWSWHWCFLINVPIGILAVALTGIFIKDPLFVRKQRRRWLRGGVKVDYVGFLLIALGLGALTLFFEEGQDYDWFASSYIAAAAVTAVVSLVCLVIWEWHHDQPVVEMRLFRDRGFAAANLLIFFIGGVLISSTQLLPQYAQALLGYSAQEAGLAMTYGALALIVLMPVAGKLSEHIQARYLVGFGLLVEAFAFYYLYGSLNLNVSFVGLTLARMGQMVGVPFVIVPTFTAAYVKLPAEMNAQGSAILNMFRAVGGTIGIALLQTGLSRTAQYHQHSLVTELTPYHAPFNQVLDKLQAGFTAAGASPGVADLQSIAVIYRLVQAQAHMLAYLNVFSMVAIAALLVVPIALLLHKTHTNGTSAGH